MKLSFTWRIKNLLVSKYFLTYLGSSVKTTNELKTQLNLISDLPIFQLTRFSKNQWSLSGGSKNPWKQRSTQHVNKTDWFFLAESEIWMSLELGIKTKLNVRLAIQQRGDLFEANISANKFSLPQGQSYIEKESVRACGRLKKIYFIQILYYNMGSAIFTLWHCLQFTG